MKRRKKKDKMSKKESIHAEEKSVQSQKSPTREWKMDKLNMLKSQYMDWNLWEISTRDRLIAMFKEGFASKQHSWGFLRR